MSHTAIPPAEIEAVVKTENIGQIRVHASADPEQIFGENEEAIDDDAEAGFGEQVEANAREYLLTEFDEVVTISEVV